MVPTMQAQTPIRMTHTDTFENTKLPAHVGLCSPNHLGHRFACLDVSPSAQAKEQWATFRQ